MQRLAHHPPTSIDAMIDQRVDDAIARRLADLLGHVDQTCCAPLERKQYLRAARRGEFPTWTVERRVVARRADFIAFLERTPSRVRAVAPSNDVDAETDFDRAFGVVNRRGAR